MYVLIVVYLPWFLMSNVGHFLVGFDMDPGKLDADLDFVGLTPSSQNSDSSRHGRTRTGDFSKKGGFGDRDTTLPDRGSRDFIYVNLGKRVTELITVNRREISTIREIVH